MIGMKTRRRHAQHRALALLGGCLTLAPIGRMAGQGAPAARADAPRVSLHALLGAFLPTGDNRRALSNAPYIGAQGAFRVRPRVALVAGIAASQTTDRRIASDEDGLTLWQYDVGVEVVPWFSAPTGHRSVVPFVGTGIGGRTYNYNRRGLERHDALAGYLSAGAELRPGVGRRAGLRAEGRTYLTHAERSGGGNLRTDVVLAAGLTYHFR